MNTIDASHPQPPTEGVSKIASASMRTVVATSALLALVLALWIPFGIDGNPQGDGWILKNWVANGQRFFVSNPTRILILLPWTLAHFLSSDSFAGAHIFLIAVFWGKALAIFAILRRLPGSNDGFAFLTAAFSIVYPASSLAISLDAGFDRHWAIFLLLVSVVALIAYWRKPHPVLLFGMWSTQIVSLWTNEAILPVAMAAPLFLLWVAGGRSRRFWRAILLWLVFPVLNAIHNGVHHVMVALNPDGMMGRSRGVAVLALEDGWRPMVESMLIAYRRHLADGWWHCLTQPDRNWSFVVLASIMVILVTIVGVLLWPKYRYLDRGLLRFLIVVGLLVIGLGFAPFVPTSLRFTHGRSFIISSVGAPLVVSAVAGFLYSGARWRGIVYRGLIGILLGVAVIGALGQHALYDRGSRAQDTILASIIEQAPQVPAETFFAVRFSDRPRDLRWAAGIHRRSNVLHNALSFLYSDPSLRSGLLSSKAYTARDTSYRLETGGVVGHTRSGQPLPKISYDRVLLFRVYGDLNVKLLRWLPTRYREPTVRNYRPLRIVDPDASLPRRWRIVDRNRLR